MTILQVLALLASLAGAAKDISGVVTDLHDLGLDPKAPIPPEHEQKIRAALSSIPSDTTWDETHTGN